MPYRTLLDLLSSGDPIRSATLNRSLQALFGNAEYLRELQAAEALGEAVFLRNRSVVSSLLVGQPAYYNSSTELWEQAGGADTLQCWGLVYQKHNSTLADIVVIGFVELDLSNAISGSVEAGQYYLSGQAAGQLTTALTTGLPVCQVAGSGSVAGTYQVYVRPGLAESGHSHRHYKFELETAPAGTAELDAGVWTITESDDSLEGWLPADHAVFEGNAPDGAVFGYNLSASDLSQHWPPVPIDGAYVEWNPGEDADHLGMGVPLGAGGLLRLTSTGLWWMSDCEGEVPWEHLVLPTTTTAP